MYLRAQTNSNEDLPQNDFLRLDQSVGLAIVTASAYEPRFVFLTTRLDRSESANLLGRVIHHYQDPTFKSTPDCPRDTLSPPGPSFADFLLEPQYDYDGRV